jgi:hypothetical protein
MCYIIKSQLDFGSMTVTIEKKNLDIDLLKVWLTSDYDYFGATRGIYGISAPYQFNVPFGKKHSTQITFKETIIKPLDCKLSDPEYISMEQCLVNIYITEHFSACPLKCLPIQMKAFQYNSVIHKLCQIR